VPNAELMLSTLAHIKDHPEEWGQDGWYAPASGDKPAQACYGVRALLLSGVQLQRRIRRTLVLADTLPEAIRESVAAATIPALLPRYAAPKVCAQLLLGVTEEQADNLFDADRTVEELEAAVAEILASGVDEFAAAQDESETIPF